MRNKCILTFLFVLVMTVSLLAACGRTSQTGSDAQVGTNGENATTAAVTSTGSEASTAAATTTEASTAAATATEASTAAATMTEASTAAATTAETSAVSVSGNGAAAVSDNLLQKDMEAVDSYRRKVFYISTPPKEAGSPIDVTAVSAYVRNPVAISYTNESKAFGSYIEQIIIADKMWERSAKDGAWTTSTPDPATKPSFQYSTRPMHYPIRFEKLSLSKAGNEQVNGFDCVRYDVSGSYQDEFTLYAGTENESKQQISLSCKGSIWVSFDPVLGQILIRERITVNRDTSDPKNLDQDGKVQHSLAEDVIEDDILDINTVTIKAPVG